MGVERESGREKMEKQVEGELWVLREGGGRERGRERKRQIERGKEGKRGS